jgi:chitinase
MNAMRRGLLGSFGIALIVGLLLGLVAAAQGSPPKDAFGTESGRSAVARTLHALDTRPFVDASDRFQAASLAAAGLPAISAPPDVIVGEADGQVTLDVTLSAESDDTVFFSVSTQNTTANSGSTCGSTDADYVGITTPQQLSFAPHTTVKTVTIPILDCTFVEGLVSFRFNITNQANATIARSSTLVSIVNNASVVLKPRLFVRDVTVDQKDGHAHVPVLLGNTSGQSSASTITVNYSTQAGTAQPGTDFGATSGTLTFAPHETAKTIDVPIVFVGKKPLTRFTVNLDQPSANVEIADPSATVTIGASALDQTGNPAISAPPDTVVGEGDGYVDLAVRLSAPGTNPVTVNYATVASTANAVGGTCSGDPDYVGVDDSLTFAPGETTKVVRVEILDCTDVEGLVSFRFNLSTPSNASLARSTALVSIVNNNTSVGTPKVFARDATVDEKDGFVLVPVLLGGPGGQIQPSTVIKVNYTTSDRTAHQGTDYSPVSGTLTFAPGQTVQNVVVRILDPAGNQAPRSFALTLTSVVDNAATIADGTATIVIGSSALPPAVQPALYAPPDVVVGEGDGYVDLVVRMSAPGTDPVSVTYTTATGNTTANTSCTGDFVTTTGTLIFAPGETTKTVRMQILDCPDIESLESFRFTLSLQSNSSIARASTLVSIVNNDAVVQTPRLFVRDAAVDEKDGTVLVPVLLGGPAGQRQDSDSLVTVTYTTEDRTAVQPGDYAQTTGTLSFAPGQTVKTVVVPIKDAGAKPSRNFVLKLLNVTSGNATIADGVGTVVIGSSAAVPVSSPGISAPPDLVVGEGDGYVDMPIRLSAPGINAVTVTYGTSSSTASAGNSCPADYVTTSGSVNFSPGETTKVVRLPLIDCTDVESLISFRFTLSNQANASIARPTTLISIVNDSTVVATPRLVVRDAVVDEKDGNVLVPVMLGGPGGQASDTPVQVDYATSDGTATRGVDYTATSGTLTFAPGQTVKNIVIPIIDAGTGPFAARSFAVTLSNPMGASLVGGDGSGIVTIGATAPPAASPLPVLSAPADFTVDEGDGYVDLPVQLMPSSVTPVSVSYTTGSISAGSGVSCPADYVSTSGSLTFAPGETLKVVRVQLLDCVDVEGLVQFRFTISSAANATFGDTQTIIGIVDNATAWTPNNTALPTVSGTVAVGQTLTATAGEWTGAPQSFQYSWQRCADDGGSCSPINGASGPNATSYVIGAADFGHALRVEVLATNSLGTSQPAYSLPTAALVSLPGAPVMSLASAGDERAYVYFSPPASGGGGSALTYTVTSSPGGIVATGTSSPVLVTGLTNGVTYTFTVTASNSVGTGPPSAASNPATPVRRPSAPPAPPAATGIPDIPPFTPPASRPPKPPSH